MSNIVPRFYSDNQYLIDQQAYRKIMSDYLEQDIQSNSDIEIYNLFVENVLRDRKDIKPDQNFNENNFLAYWLNSDLIKKPSDDYFGVQDILKAIIYIKPEWVRVNPFTISADKELIDDFHRHGWMANPVYDLTQPSVFLSRCKHYACKNCADHEIEEFEKFLEALLIKGANVNDLYATKDAGKDVEKDALLQVLSRCADEFGKHPIPKEVKLEALQQIKTEFLQLQNKKEIAQSPFLDKLDFFKISKLFFHYGFEMKQPSAIYEEYLYKNCLMDAYQGYPIKEIKELAKIIISIFKEMIDFYNVFPRIQQQFKHKLNALRDKKPSFIDITIIRNNT